MKLGYPLTKLLNPCPFCGNNDNFEWEYHEGWSLPFKLSCSVCGATTSNWESKEECLDYWNKRYQPSLQLSEESRKFLKELYHEIVTQDNRGTANPYFVVKTTRKIQGFHPDYSNNLEYMDMSGNGDYESYPTKEEAIQALIKDYEYSSSEAEVYFEDHFEKFGYRIEEQYHNFFLTEKGYNDHMRLNAHNYGTSAHSYVNCALRNPEYERLIKAIKEIGEQLKEI